MTDINEFAEHTDNDESSIQQKEQTRLKPLYRQFTPKLAVLLLTIIMMVGLTATLFYQNNSQNSALVENQLVSLTQHLTYMQALQKADQLVSQLLVGANAENFVELHAKLVALDRQLLHLSGANEQRFQQWLNDNKLATDIVSRIQDSYVRNTHLKQNSVIQLQLMLFSITPIIDKTLARQIALQQQLQAKQGKVTFSQVSAYIKIVQQLNDLQQLKVMLANILASFEQLTIQTPMANFESLRLDVKQFFTQHKQLIAQATASTLTDFNQQIDTFEKIVLTEQRALAKWQGYIRLAQDYQLNLKAQQQQIHQLLLVPYQYQRASDTSIIQEVLARINLSLSNQQIMLVLMSAIGLSLLLFFYTLWRLRKHIKVSIEQSVEIIHRSLQRKAGRSVVANCVETQSIMQKIQHLVKPEHNEREFQALSEQYQSSQQLFELQKQKLAQVIAENEQQKLGAKAQIAAHLNSELHYYQSLKSATLPLLQQQQAEILKQKTLSKNNNVSVSTQLASLYQQLMRFHLIHEMKAEHFVLTFHDINLVDEINAILLNKQQEQQLNENQLFISFDEQLFSQVISSDEQLMTQVRIDFRLFEQLINLLIDISLQDCQASKLHLHVHLQGKRIGQQLVNFVVKVQRHSTEALPGLLTQLLDSQSANSPTSPLIELFNLLLAKQHGSNIAAQLIDGGYQLSFELPLAIAASVDSVDKVMLENTKVMLLSNNIMLAEVVEEHLLSAKGQFEHLVHIDSFQQQVNAKELTRHQLDLLIVASDMALTHLDLISQQIGNLPKSLQPKLMVLQTPTLSYERFGFYAQTEQILCKNSFLHNVKKLLDSPQTNNQLLPCEPFASNQYSNSQLPLLLAMHSPERSQNLQRLLQWLGLQVHVVSHEAAQQSLWQTGQYSLLITEFAEAALLDMTSKPRVDVAVFSLTKVVPQPDHNTSFKQWHFGRLTTDSTLTELSHALAPWLEKPQDVTVTSKRDSDDSLLAQQVESFESMAETDEFMITEVASVLTDHECDAVFDFAHYLQHQGTVELALFMLDDYSQDNHQQLDTLVDAIKAKNIEKAKLSVAALALNANILSAQALQLLCVKWSKVLNGSETPSSLLKINSLLKETRIALNAIDEYAEAI